MVQRRRRLALLVASGVPEVTWLLTRPPPREAAVVQEEVTRLLTRLRVLEAGVGQRKAAVGAAAQSARAVRVHAAEAVAAGEGGPSAAFTGQGWRGTTRTPSPPPEDDAGEDASLDTSLSDALLEGCTADEINAAVLAGESNTEYDAEDEAENSSSSPVAPIRLERRELVPA